MSALSHRHDGGRRLHRTARDLPAGSGYVMSPRRPARHVTLNTPPDQRRDVAAVTASSATQDTPRQPPNAQCPPAVRVQDPDRRCASRQTAGWTLPTPLWRNGWPRSTPIVLAGGAV